MVPGHSRVKNALFAEALCHNCATKPVWAAKIDFVDESLLLILRNLLKAKDAPEIPAYRLIRYIICLETTTLYCSALSRFKCALRIQINPDGEELRTEEAHGGGVRGAAGTLAGQPALALARIIIY